MMNLLYLSHTVVPGHLEELSGLGVLERDEQVLVALDGVLLDETGQRLSGPTLHDYCLLTSMRIMLWARTYGRHVCYAFPLTELRLVEGMGIDPLHAQLELTFEAPDEAPQRFSLTLLPLTDLAPAVTLLHLAAEAAQELCAAQVDPYTSGQEITALIGAQVYGTVEGDSPHGTPYRWPGAHPTLAAATGSIAPPDPTNLPPEQIYSASRLVRSAWDTLRKGLREAELPFDLNSTNLREMTDTVRAINDLLTTVVSQPAAREMAMAFINSRRPAPDERRPAAEVERPPAPDVSPPPAASASAYREIPLRRRETAAAEPPPAPPTPKLADVPVPVPTPDRRDLPLRRRHRSGNQPPIQLRPQPSLSGSGDAQNDA